VHQVGLKYFGSKNFSFLAFKGEAVGVTQISSYNGNGRRVTDGKKLSLKSCFLGIFPSQNQYFPHIPPYVASKMSF
jgi:hypothetical protein